MQRIINKLETLELVDFQIKDCYWVEVTHINNPHNFYVRSLSYKTYLKTLEVRGDPITLEQLATTPIVIYKSKTLKQYVRGKIMSVIYNEEHQIPRCDLLAIDYGCFDELVSIKRIWVPLHITNVKPLAVLCKLHLCVPIGEDWTEKDVKNMKHFVGTDCVQIRICAKERRALIVEIYSCDTDDVSSLMMYIGSSSFGFIGNSINKINAIKPLAKYFRPIQLEFGKEIHVRVLNGSSLQDFYVAQVDDYRKYKENLNDFKDYCRWQNKPELDDIRIGDSYGVLIIGDNSYERGVVKKIYNEGKLVMYLVDKGETISVPYEHLRTLNSQIYYKICPVAIHCTAEKSQIWNNGPHKFLYPGFEFFITIKDGTGEENPYVVDITPLK